MKITNNCIVFHALSVICLATADDRGIVGGVPVESGTYPYYCVSAADGFCGCSLIHPDILLTAAHCISAFSAGQTVYLGGVKRSGVDATAVTVRQTFSDPLYQAENFFDRDFMLVKIDEDMTGVPLPNWNADPNVPSPDETCVTFGFGVTEDGTISEDLLQVQMAAVSNTECEDFTGGLFTDSMLCVGGENGRSTCSGDSGSPLIRNNEIVGVTSFGDRYCCDALAGSRSVFARVSEADMFIKEGICLMSEVSTPAFCADFTSSPTTAPTTTPPAPGNDECSNAMSLGVGPTANSGSTLGATFDDVGFCGTINSSPGVWYTLVGDGTAYIVDTCSNNAYDTRLSVFSGSCGSLACVTGNDQSSENSCVEGGSQVVFDAQVGVDYFILVHGTFTFAGAFELNVRSYVPPDNDNCANAIPLGVDTTLSGTSEFASVDSDSSTCWKSVTAPSVWYKTTGTGETFTVSTCQGPSSFDTYISVYSGSTCGSLSCVRGNDDSCGDQSLVTWDTVDGEEYYILVFAYFTGDSGPFMLDLKAEPTTTDDETGGDGSGGGAFGAISDILSSILCFVLFVINFITPFADISCS